MRWQQDNSSQVVDKVRGQDRPAVLWYHSDGSDDVRRGGEVSLVCRDHGGIVELSRYSSPAEGRSKVVVIIEGKICVQEVLFREIERELPGKVSRIG